MLCTELELLLCTYRRTKGHGSPSGPNFWSPRNKSLDPGTIYRWGCLPLMLSPTSECMEFPFSLVKLLKNLQSKQGDSAERVASDVRRYLMRWLLPLTNPHHLSSPPSWGRQADGCLSSLASAQAGSHIQADVQKQTGRRGWGNRGTA